MLALKFKKGQYSLEAGLSIVVITFFIVLILVAVNDKSKIINEKKQFIRKNGDCTKLSSIISEISSKPGMEVNLTMNNNFNIYQNQMIDVNDVLCYIRPKIGMNISNGSFEKGKIKISNFEKNIIIQND